MKPHLRYLRYVLLHKLYVFRAGVAINGWSLRWIWRLIVHDLSKFGRMEWGPYVATFYAIRGREWIGQRQLHHLRPHEGVSTNQALAVATEEWAAEERDRKAAFDRAWLHHQHVNPHHWQHWMLREDSGKTILLLPPAVIIDEMVADWCAAGQKILARPTVAACVAETVLWYVKNRNVIQLRAAARDRVEKILAGLASDYGITEEAYVLRVAQEARESIVIPGR